MTTGTTRKPSGVRSGLPKIVERMVFSPRFSRFAGARFARRMSSRSYAFFALYFAGIMSNI